MPAVREAARQRLAETENPPPALAEIPNPKSQIPNRTPPRALAGKPVAPNVKPPPDPAKRQRLHQEKLRQLELARRRGLPCLFEFDPADGPLPPLIHQIDGAPA